MSAATYNTCIQINELITGWHCIHMYGTGNTQKLEKQRTFMLMLIVCIKKFKVNLISITNSIEKHKIRVENEMGAVLHIKWLICVCALTIIQNAP